MNVEIDLAEWRLVLRAVEVEERHLRRAEAERRRLWRATHCPAVLEQAMAPAPDPDLARAVRLRAKLRRVIDELVFVEETW